MNPNFYAESYYKAPSSCRDNNRTGWALELILSQQSQTRAAVYQNKLTLDYLLAEEGGVRGKFNTSDCCLKIDDNGDSVLDIAKISEK